ncbi:carbamoyltransferase [Labrenzia sp. EL_142]|nr:carbamoyltransferase [Labrenzia sp. EL_142]
MSDWILGLASSHDGAACLLKGGHIHTAIREERLSGVKRQRLFAGERSLAVPYCLQSADLSASELAAVCVASQRAADEIENEVTLNPDLRGTPDVPKWSVSHHLAHAASAVALSDFESCAILVCDGEGSPLRDVSQGSTTRVFGPRDGHEHLSLYRAKGRVIEPLEIHTCLDWVRKNDAGLWGFGSLGGMYAAVSHMIFGSADEAGKVMGLAPYGKPIFAAGDFFTLGDDGFSFSDKVQEALAKRGSPRDRQALHANLAASVQAALEGALLALAIRLRKMTGERRLCLAGGVALNCTANQLLYKRAGFDEVFVVPAADDAGTAIGAAYLAHWETSMPSLRGPVGRKESLGAPLEAATLEPGSAALWVKAVTPDDLIEDIACRLADGEIGAWVQDGSEFGPRSLGQRSIVAAPTFEDMKDCINQGVKFREAFRPFAPALPASCANAWFDFDETSPESPFMLRAVLIKPEARKRIPAVCHVDNTGRLQTLTSETNGVFYELARRMEDKTGAPVILNTSLNLMGEPIAETAEDALWVMLGTTMTFCVIGARVYLKKPTFRSVLDLTPRVCATSWTLKLPVEGGRLSRSTNREDAFSAEVETHWGRIIIPVEPRLTPVLSAIDGHLDGHGLLNKLAPQGATAQHLRHDLLLLRRMRLIALENHER